MTQLESLHFDNRFARLGEAFFTHLPPTPLQGVYLATANPDAALLLDLDADQMQRPEFLAMFSGQKMHPGFDPLAMVYSGHQFGAYNPQLGDGRGILLGEITNAQGEHWDIHLKGAGRTPYSRFGDGRAVLRSCIREYLGSEALHHLGIPTTRALCIFGSREAVQRETVEQGAALIRLAASHVRFGSFEYFHYNRRGKELDVLADFVIRQHYPEFLQARNPHAELFRRAVETTAALMAQWQNAGFAHGVMNTDNMSIIGISFDYGPFGFLDQFDPAHICNHSDQGGRYAYQQQPGVGLWNLNALAQVFLRWVPQEELVDALKQFEPRFLHHFYRGMSEKLGLVNGAADDNELMGDLLLLLGENQPDYHIFFRRLSHLGCAADPAPVSDLFPDREAFLHWLQRYRQRLAQQALPDAERLQSMRRHNPKYILRNHLAQNAIAQAEQGDFSEVERLRVLLKNPFDEQPDMERYADFPPDWSKSLQISCSS